MESGAISDGQISASSEWHANNGASRGRLHSQVEGSKAAGWSARMFDAHHEWLQVVLFF